jgi:hypothetical protein
MQTNHLFSAAVFEKWKQQARQLKRSTNIAHHEALDALAQRNQFQDWHHVTVEAGLNRLSEKAIRQGFVVAYDVKEASESPLPDELFIEDWRAPHFADRDVFAWYVSGDEADSGPMAVNEEYCQEYSEWAENLCYFRFCGPMPQNVEEGMRILGERCFFPPVFVWFRGNFLEPWRDLAKDGVLSFG